MNLIDIINLISSIASLIISIIAIWLSIYFYTKSKDVEGNTKTMLGEIKAQTDALQKLTGRWMDRLTKHATDTSSYDSTLTQLIEVIKIIPSNANSSFPELQGKVDNLTKEAISGYIGMHHYCAITNVFAQFKLPSLDTFDQNNEYHELVKTVIDNSYQNFHYLDKVLENIEKSSIDSNPIGDWYYKTINYWKVSIKDSTGVFQERSEDV